MSMLEENQMSIPHLFRCPISLDLFTDPVTLSTGQTYDRSSIEKWLADGNLTCPVTMQRLHDLSMVPNRTLRQLIDRWLLSNTHSDAERIKTTDPNPSLATLKSYIQSLETTFTTRLETLRKIRTLSKESDSRRICLIQLGFFSSILELLFGDIRAEIKLSLQDLELAEEALNCLLNLLPCTEMGHLNMLKESSSLASFLLLLNQGGMKIKTSLCCMLEAISSSSETKELCLVFGQTPAVLQGLVSLLHQQSDICASDAAIRAISGLCSLEMNRGSVIREGGVDGLIKYLSKSDRRYASIALATLELLLGLESGKRAVISNPDGVHFLVKMVFRVSYNEGSESAVSCLLIVCYDSLRARQQALGAGVLTQILLLLQSQCSCRAKTKARLLLKLLRSMWVEDPRMFNLQYGLFDS
ncbi:U-box domain-containing protein 26-like [Magnolia sinica]|uniref:U-box domain-containing protein 26-like n=1 Tax=Magnolia sinica TaxID=86752 RepID=UPI00265A7E06|nr:U-box domain-containing protein 26-like [Magnolia sinica]